MKLIHYLRRQSPYWPKKTEYKTAVQETQTENIAQANNIIPPTITFLTSHSAEETKTSKNHEASTKISKKTTHETKFNKNKHTGSPNNKAEAINITFHLPITQQQDRDDISQAITRCVL